MDLSSGLGLIMKTLKGLLPRMDLGDRKEELYFKKQLFITHMDIKGANLETIKKEPPIRTDPSQSRTTTKSIRKAL